MKSCLFFFAVCSGGVLLFAIVQGAIWFGLRMRFGPVGVFGEFVTSFLCALFTCKVLSWAFSKQIESFIDKLALRADKLNHQKPE